MWSVTNATSKTNNLLLSGIFSIALCIVGAFLFSAPALATLEGEDGRIIYVEGAVTEHGEEVAPVDAVANEEIPPDVVDPTKIITTAPDGSGDVVAATSTNDVETATLSKPDTTTGNSTVVFSEETTCLVADPEVKTLDEGVANPCVTVDPDVMTEASLSMVTIDKDGNPVSEVTKVVTFEPLINVKGVATVDDILELSISPDGTEVLVTRRTSPPESEEPHTGGNTLTTDAPFEVSLEPETKIEPLTTVERVNLATGAITVVVTPRVDKYVSAGYADNGDIYFSLTDVSEVTDIAKDTEESKDTNIWVIKAGQAEAAQLTFTPNISEFFIDVAPDNSVVLVADVTKGNNEADKKMGPPCMLYPSRKYYQYVNCTYYYVSTVNGTSVELVGLAEGFVPIFFSPEGTHLIGTLYAPKGNHNDQLAKASDQENGKVLPVTAIVARADLGTATKLTDQIGVQEWAPLVEKIVPVTIVESATTTAQQVTTKLSYTGSNALAQMILSMSLLVAAVATIGLTTKTAKETN